MVNADFSVACITDTLVMKIKASEVSRTRRMMLSVSAENLVLLVRGWIARRPPGRLVFCILTIFRLKCKA